MKGAPLLKSDYVSKTTVYDVKSPEIVSGATYYFETDSKLIYQVTFGKKKDNYLGNIVNFSVISEDFEDEYSETNRGEVYRIIATMIHILGLYHEAHPYSNSYEFSGEYKDDEDNALESIRTRLYLRAILQVVNLEYWNLNQKGNKVVLSRKPRND